MSWSMIGATNNSNDGAEKTRYTKLEGTVTGRVLDDEPVTNWTHWVQNMNGGKGGSVDCIGKETCPICQIIEADKAAGRPKKYSSSKKHKINFLNRKTGEVEVLNSGETVFEGLKNIMIQMGDLKNIDVSITKTGEKKQTKYAVLPVIKMGVSPAPLSDAERALPKYDLTTLNKPLTPEQIVGLLEGKSYKDVFTKPEDVQEESDNVDFTAE